MSFSQTITGEMCLGNTTSNTQRCQDCSASCPSGTYISPSVQRCSGTTYAVNVDDASRPFDPVSECIACADCPSAGETRVSGCAGSLRYDDGVCQECLQCRVGQYISGDCSSGATCTACPLCPAGKYLAKPCSGRQLGAPDQVVILDIGFAG